MKIDNAHALVTGGSNGVGVDIARELSRRGARVTVLGRDAERLDAVAAEIGGHAVRADLADIDQVHAAAEAAEKNGPVDILVNNAAIAPVRRVTESSSLDAHRTVAINTVAPMELTQHFLPGMVERGRGSIVNISSLAGVSAIIDLAAYCGSKAALHHYTAVVQRELRHTKSPVTVTLATLGEVAGTSMMEDARQSPVIAAVSARLSRLHALPSVTTTDVARGVADAVESGRPYVSVPRTIGGLIGLRNLPSRIQDLTLIGIKSA